jgi:hypothetical protein
MSRFSQMPARTSVKTGATKGKPGSAPAANSQHNKANKELQMSRITVQFLAQQAADTNARMDRLMGTVESLVDVVARLIPGAAAPVAVAAPVAPVAPVVAAAETVAAAAESAIDKRNAALARGRATAAANRAARKGTSAPAAPAPAPAAAPVADPVKTEKAAARAAYVARVALPKVKKNGATGYVGKIGRTVYAVIWNRTAAAWDWQFAPAGQPVVKGRTSGVNARGLAFAALNAVAETAGATKVRAGQDS